ncbi:WD repeat-containing protein 44, partial [Ophiophagus hannah]
IIDNIIEESQKANRLEEDPLAPPEKELTNRPLHADPWVSGADLHHHIPELFIAEAATQGPREAPEGLANGVASQEASPSPPPSNEGAGHSRGEDALKKFLGKSVKRARHLAEEYGERAVNKVKSVRDEVFHTDQDDPSSSDDEGMPYTRPVKFKAAHGFKGPYDFEQVKVVQDLSGEHMVSRSPHSHSPPGGLAGGPLARVPSLRRRGSLSHLCRFGQGAVWTMKFSHCGRLLASAGQDNLVRIWVLKTAFDYFNNMRMKYNSEGAALVRRASSLGSRAANLLNWSRKGVALQRSPLQRVSCLAFQAASPPPRLRRVCSGTDEDPDDKSTPFRQRPFCKYKGHTADLLDLSWSKNYFLLSSSMDKTVRLWHISRRECLCCFQHIDFVTAIAFHPRDDRYFLSGSLDGKLRLWNIPDKKVALWNEVDGQTKLITAANFCQNGKYAVIGTYDGRCIFYDTEHLKYHTQIHVRSTRGRNRVGRKITGIEPLPGENKYKGYVNSSSQIKASFSHDFTYIVSGSEDKYVYIWSTYHDLSKFSSVRRDRNDFWEGVKAHNAVVTSAIFAPNPSLMVSCETAEKPPGESQSEDSEGGDPIPS